jgi:hypothetical protein
MTYVSLPLILLTFSLFVGVALGNPGFLLFFLGQLLVLFITWLVQKIPFMKYISQPSSDILQLVPSEPVISGAVTAPTYWMTFMSFFLAYITTNAGFVYTMGSEKKSSIEYENRRGKATMIMITSFVMFFAFATLRLFYQDLETPLGLILAVAIGIPAGAGWYYLSNSAGIRHADVFGIVTQIIPKEAAGGGPKTCYYVASAN